MGHSFVRRLKDHLAGAGIRLGKKFTATVIQGFGGMQLEFAAAHRLCGTRKADFDRDRKGHQRSCVADVLLFPLQEFAALTFEQNVVILELMLHVTIGVNRKATNNLLDKGWHVQRDN